MYQAACALDGYIEWILPEAFPAGAFPDNANEYDPLLHGPQVLLKKSIEQAPWKKINLIIFRKVV